MPRQGGAAAEAAAAIEELDLGGERLEDAVLLEAVEELDPEVGYSSEGLRRLELLRLELRDLRGRLDQSLPDLVADIAQTIGLDVEVAVHGGSATTAGLARAHLDAIGDVAARFAEETEGGTMSAFLAYLAAAEEEERGLTPGEVEVVAGAVQILTVHASRRPGVGHRLVAGICENSFVEGEVQRPLADRHGRAAVSAARGRGRTTRTRPG